MEHIIIEQEMLLNIEASKANEIKHERLALEQYRDILEFMAY